MKKEWLLAFVGLTVLWGACVGLMHWVRSQRSTADSVSAYVEKVDFSSLSASRRQAWLDELADRINRMEFEERQKWNAQRSLGELFPRMTEAEQRRFVEATLPQGFNQLIESLNRMTPEQRKRLVERGLRQMEEGNAANGQDRPFDEETTQRFIQQGFQSYLENATAETKMDMAPLLEQIQMNLQGLRGP